MVRTLGIVVAVLAVLVGGFAGYVASQPGAFVIERQAQMDVPAEAVFDQIDDFTSFLAWNPWRALDPDQTIVQGGPEAGVGAWYTWSGDDNVGEGRMEILEVQDDPGDKKVVYDLQFIRPFAAHNRTEITVVHGEGGSTVTWSMSGENDFFGKAAGLFMDMDAMVGADFERGLATLQERATAASMDPPGEGPDAGKDDEPGPDETADSDAD